MATAHRALVCLLLVLAGSAGGAASKSFTIANSCEYTVWPGILSSAGSAGMDSTGFALAPGESRTMAVPSGWSGRLWGRTLCSTDGAGKFTCVTGDCGSGRQDCAGGGAAPPATLAEFTMDGSGGMDFYDVSLVDGYNLPVLVAPQGAAAGGNCAPTGCMVDLNGACPADLRVASASSPGGGGVACRSACEAFGSAEYCCSGEHGNPSTCKPSAYSQFFKNACPRAYSYAYDDATSTFTCAGGATTYAITFCPSTTRSIFVSSRFLKLADYEHSPMISVVLMVALYWMCALSVLEMIKKLEKKNAPVNLNFLRHAFSDVYLLSLPFSDLRHSVILACTLTCCLIMIVLLIMIKHV